MSDEINAFIHEIHKKADVQIESILEEAKKKAEEIIRKLKEKLKKSLHMRHVREFSFSEEK